MYHCIGDCQSSLQNLVYKKFLTYLVRKSSPTEPTTKSLECSEKIKCGEIVSVKTFTQFRNVLADSCLFLGTAAILCQHMLI